MFWCVNLTENDARHDAAANRLHERRCADGLLSPGAWEKPGWESDCESFIPDDVECTVYGIYGASHGFAPGVVDTTGECIVPNCTAEDLQDGPQPGYRCVAAARYLRGPIIEPTQATPSNERGQRALHGHPPSRRGDWGATADRDQCFDATFDTANSDNPHVNKPYWLRRQSDVRNCHSQGIARRRGGPRP